MHLLSDFDNMDVVFGDESSNPIERKLANTINGLIRYNDADSFCNNRGNSSPENQMENSMSEIKFLDMID